LDSGKTEEDGSLQLEEAEEDAPGVVALLVDGERALEGVSEEEEEEEEEGEEDDEGGGVGDEVTMEEEKEGRLRRGVVTGGVDGKERCDGQGRAELQAEVARVLVRRVFTAGEDGVVSVNVCVGVCVGVWRCV
jgi:hypothetical protein